MKAEEFWDEVTIWDRAGFVSRHIACAGGVFAS
jgi:hypothetical protein